MDDINKIVQRLKENDKIYKKFHQVETSILSILNFKNLFEVLLTEISDKFKIPYVWLSIAEHSEVSNLIKSLESSIIVKNRLNIINRKILLNLINNDTKPLLINDNLESYFKLFPNDKSYLIRSMSIIPIVLDGKIIGTLNQADFSRNRFEPGISTLFLEHLAVKVSLCLSNVTAHEKLKFLAYHDPLTKLVNRRAMENILNREFRRAKRYKNTLSVAFIDLDHFKCINDKYGHDCGDYILKYMAKTLSKMTRDHDVVSRYAGDEFVIILPETHPKEAENLIIRIQKYLQKKPIKIEKNPYFMSFSFGIASNNGHSMDKACSLLKKSDEMLYRMKTKKKKK